MPPRTPTNDKYAGMSLPKDRQHLVTDNLRLVNYVLNKYIKPASSEYEDYEQVGRTGLIMAAIGWDETKGKRFATYATQMIWGYCKTYRRQVAPVVKYDRKTTDNHCHIAQLGAEGKSNNEIMEELGITPAEYAEAAFMYSPDSLDQPVIISNGDNPGTLADLIPDGEGAESSYEETEIEVVFMEALAKTLEGIEQKQADIYEEYVYSLIAGEPLKQRYFAAKYDLSQSYVSRIISKLHKKYKQNLRQQGINI